MFHITLLTALKTWILMLFAFPGLNVYGKVILVFAFGIFLYVLVMGVLNIALIVVFLNSDMKKLKFPRISTNYFQVLGLHLSTPMT